MNLMNVALGRVNICIYKREIQLDELSQRTEVRRNKDHQGVYSSFPFESRCYHTCKLSIVVESALLSSLWP